MNMIDRLVGYVSPERGVQRAAKRQQMEQMLGRGWDAAGQGRRTSNWNPPDTSGDTEVGRHGPRLRRRSRDLARNNPHVAKAKSAWVSNLIGNGIQPDFDTGSDQTNRRLNELWDTWANTTKFDLDGQVTFAGFQRLATDEMIEGGESLARRRVRSANDAIPMQVQLHEAEQLDESQTMELPGGGRIIQGVQFNEQGERTGYYMLPRHPGDDLIISHTRLSSSRFVPAGDMLHMYEKARQQTRGVPWSAPVMLALRDLHDWQQAELVRKKTEAALVGIVTGDGAAEEGVAPRVEDADGNIVEQFEPGLIAYARGGTNISFNQPTTAGDIEQWLRQQLHIIAAGFRLPYELLTGDLSQVNFSSMRASIVEFRRLVFALQRQVIVPLLCQPIANWFIEGAILRGAVGANTPVQVQWTTPRFESVNVLDDAKADSMEVRHGFKSWRTAVAERGQDPDKVMQEIAETNEMFDQQEIVLDSDPRNVAEGGKAQGAGADFSFEEGQAAQQSGG